MSLESIDRGLLEQRMDNILRRIPVLIHKISKKNICLAIKEENDFAIGMACGGILTAFIVAYTAAHKKEPSEEELDEVLDFVDNRSGKIREAMYNAC